MEIELKLLLPPADLHALAAHPRVLERVRLTRRPVLLHSVYFDTPNGDLRKRGIALRLRRDRGRWRQTLKGPGEAVAGLHARGEFEWPVPGKALALDLLAQTPHAKLFEKGRVRGALAPVFVTEFRRRVIDLAFPDGTKAELCLDAGEIRAGRKTAPISEAEIELVKGEPRTLIEFAVGLSDSVSFRLGHASKAERAWLLALGEPPTPRHAARIELDAGEPSLQAVIRILSSCLSHMGANSEGLIASRNPEFLHQFRIALRRLRVALVILPDERWRKRIAAEKHALQKLSAVLGTARNWNVFIAEILPPITRHFGGGRMAPLIARAAAQRRRHGSAAQEAIASRAFSRTNLRLALLLAELHAADIGPEAGVRRFAADTLKRRRHKLLKHAPSNEQPSAHALHALRIEAKKLRYTAEFFASLFPTRKVRDYVEALATLQTVLGEVNDAAVAQQLIEREGQGTKPLAAGICGLAQGWIAATEARNKTAYATAWKQFQKTKSFW